MAHRLNLLGKQGNYSCNSPNVTASEGLPSALLLTDGADGWGLPCYLNSFLSFPPKGQRCAFPPSIPTFFVTPLKHFPISGLQLKQVSIEVCSLKEYRLHFVFKLSGVLFMMSMSIFTHLRRNKVSFCA